jgi:hypothetical protein
MNQTNSPLTRRISTRRRAALLATPVGLALATGFGHSRIGAQAVPDNATVVDPHERPVPWGFNPGDLVQADGARPVAIEVAAAGVDAGIETINIIDGVMLDPTDPLLVSWYEDSAKLGNVGNVLFAGHVNWFSVGAAVFFNLTDLVEGDEVVVTGDDGELYRYVVQWNETVELATLTPKRMGELVGPTKAECVTLITCGGEFDAATGHYLSRTVVRGKRLRD